MQKNRTCRSTKTVYDDVQFEVASDLRLDLIEDKITALVMADMDRPVFCSDRCGKAYRKHNCGKPNYETLHDHRSHAPKTLE